MWGWAGCCGVRGSFSAWPARTERHVLQSRLAQLLIGGRKVEEIVDHLPKRNGSDHLSGNKTRTAAAFRSDLDGPQDHVQKGNRNETLVRGQPCNAWPQHIRRHVAEATTHKASAPHVGAVGGSGPSSVGALVMRSLAGVRGDGGGLGGKVSLRVCPPPGKRAQNGIQTSRLRRSCRTQKGAPRAAPRSCTRRPSVRPSCSTTWSNSTWRERRGWRGSVKYCPADAEG